ncbi:MAG: hypothetical protein ACFFAU_03640 [Candidatus Hodarchaeota archaeon]
MISGLIVTTMTDIGPYPLLNLSSISEDTTVKLSVIGMTILSMGAGTVAERTHYRLHGSIPIPDSPTLEALAMSFTVTPTKTRDVRINQHGRESTIWLIFESKDREAIFLRHRSIETALREEAKAIREENELANPSIMQRLLNRIKDITKDTSIAAGETLEEPPHYVAERGGLEFHTIDEAGNLITLNTNFDLKIYSVLILVNRIIKRIFIIKLNDTIPQRLVFLAGRTASNLNSKRFKSEFNIRNVTDPLEREMILEKIGILQKIGT